jgi:hypothetical protein
MKTRPVGVVGTRKRTYVVVVDGAPLAQVQPRHHYERKEEEGGKKRTKEMIAAGGGG